MASDEVDDLVDALDIGAEIDSLRFVGVGPMLGVARSQAAARHPADVCVRSQP